MHTKLAGSRRSRPADARVLCRPREAEEDLHDEEGDDAESDHAVEHDEVLGATPEVATVHHRQGDTESANNERDAQKLARAMSHERFLAHVGFFVKVDAASYECTSRKEAEGRQSHDQAMGRMGCCQMRVTRVGIFASLTHGWRRRCRVPMVVAVSMIVVIDCGRRWRWRRGGTMIMAAVVPGTGEHDGERADGDESAERRHLEMLLEEVGCLHVCDHAMLGRTC